MAPLHAFATLNTNRFNHKILKVCMFLILTCNKTYNQGALYGNLNRNLRMTMHANCD